MGYKFGDQYLLAIFPFMFIMTGLLGCGNLDGKTKAETPKQGGKESLPSVEVAIAGVASLGTSIIYTGDTQPIREVSVRSQVEGRLLTLQADLGDRIIKGQILAQLDDTLLQTALGAAEAELAAQESEVARTRNQVNHAQTSIKQAEVELKQAKVDAQRLLSLAQAGAISRQQAELAQTKADVAAQTLISAQEQRRIEAEQVAIALKRVNAQSSVVAQLRERRSYAFIYSPLSGVVLQRLTEPGNLVQSGGEVLKIGDFSQVKVITPISELDFGKIAIGQSVKVRLDAFPQQTFTGVINRISPAATATTRQIPVEITISNPDGKIGSGLLARVELSNKSTNKVVIPETALQGDNQDTVFIVTGSQQKATVVARTVKIGERLNNRVTILSQLQPGERYVIRSSRPLKSGESARLSVLSE